MKNERINCFIFFLFSFFKKKYFFKNKLIIIKFFFLQNLFSIYLFISDKLMANVFI